MRANGAYVSMKDSNHYHGVALTDHAGFHNPGVDPAKVQLFPDRRVDEYQRGLAETLVEFRAASMRLVGDLNDRRPELGDRLQSVVEL